MQVYILEGSKDAKEGYISSFIEEKKIPSYFVNRFEQLKIADARILQKSFATKLPKDSYRVSIISSPTVEAQNAILKTIEELGDSNYVFFLVSSKDDILSTILSRSKLISFGSEEKKRNIELERYLEEVVISEKNARGEKILSFINSLGDVIEKDSIDMIQLSLRNLLYFSGKENRKYYFLLLKNLVNNSYLTSSYNVQKKLFLENIFIETLNKAC